MTDVLANDSGEFTAMDSSTITISVPEEAARAFESASQEQRKKIEILLGLRLQELVHPSKDSLLKLMEEIGREAQRNGLTPEALEAILNEPSDV